jgi:molybdopterin/thiamine biosynthesis adenylyltransferase
MRRHITFSRLALRQLLRRTASDPSHSLYCRAGTSRRADTIEWLLHNPDSPDASSRLLAVTAASEGGLQAAISRARARLADTDAVILALGIGPAVGRVAAVAISHHRIEPIDTISIVGPGMPSVRLTTDGSGGDTSMPCTRVPDAKVLPSEAWSRTIGALGEATWRRLINLRVGIIGCGRSGSLVAEALTSLGIQRLTLIDPDLLENHNLGESAMCVALEDIGRNKAQTLAKSIAKRSFMPGSAPSAIEESILSLASLTRAKETDLLFCCVDNSAASVAVTFLAAVYLKPLIVVGTGIFHGNQTQARTEERSDSSLARQLGADVRLLLPGRCLLCFGGIANLPEALAELLVEPAAADHFRRNPIDWRRQRAGSLRSLNGLIVNLAVRLLEDFIGGRVSNNTWLRLDFSETGIPVLEHRTPPRVPCPVCRLTGHGDEGLGEFRLLLRDL